MDQTTTIDVPMDDLQIQDTVSEPEDEQQWPTNPPPLSSADQQRLSLFILTQRDRPIPPVESMKKFLDSPDDVDARVAELNEQHAEDLERLYLALSEEYMDEAEDRYYSCDEKMLQEFPEVQTLYDALRGEDSNPQPEWEYAVAHTAHTYRTRLEEITRHQVKKVPPKATEFEFPQSIDEYRLKPKETQHRAARFLVLETDEQREKMMAEFNWTPRLVSPLKDELETNQEFQEEVRATIVELNVGDPRKRA
ncbi:hypothetical protein DFH06DRAFT_1180747 [Mycena polygramma]|nr:hypothetical protein DFH06DRAFT_1180747 [Mycena polygramma]